MTKSNFTYQFLEFEGQKFLAIEDIGIGMSVTNDIENVVAYIEHRDDIIAEAPEYYIIYRDSQGFWDGWQKPDNFINLNCEFPERAMLLYKRNIIEPENKVATFFPGDPVMYIPRHLMLGNDSEMVKDENLGVISSIQHGVVFVKYKGEDTAQNTPVENLFKVTRPDLLARIEKFKEDVK